MFFLSDEIKVTGKDIFLAFGALILVILISLIFLFVIFAFFSPLLGIILAAIGFSITGFVLLGSLIIGLLGFWYIVYAFLKELFDKKSNSSSDSSSFTLDRIKEAK